MISHALTIVMNELNTFLSDTYNSVDSVSLGNISDVFATGSGNTGATREMLYLSMVNVREEKTLKNIPTYVRNDVALTTTYENPPIFLNFVILLTATHADYTNALSVLSRAIRFFQFKNAFTQDNVAPASITTSKVPINPLDQLDQFRLIFDLYSPTMEEVNYLWGTLGGKQYPFVLYILRLLDLKFRAVQSESGLITDVISNFRQIPGAP